MKIIVNDTNIFIDLHSVDLLEALCDLPYDIRTVDFVVNEVTNHAQAEALEVMINEEKVKVEELSVEELTEILTEHAKVPGNISVPDCSVCYCARKYSATLLTGDRQLRKYAEKCEITVKGVLFLFDEFVGHGILPPQVAAEKLRRLTEINIRLPKSEIEARLKKWS